jgi:hypothetical protein
VERQFLGEHQRRRLRDIPARHTFFGQRGVQRGPYFRSWYVSPWFRTIGR